MPNIILLKTGVLYCLFFFITACGSDKGISYVSALKGEQDTYRQTFQKSFQDLKQQSDQVKVSVAADTVLLQKIAAIDNKINVYQERSSQKLDKYQILLEKLTSGTLTEEEMKTYHPQYISDFETYKDAIRQLGEGLTEIAQKK